MTTFHRPNRYTFQERLQYYKDQIKYLQNENENLINRNADLLKEITDLNCKVHVLENKLRRFVHADIDIRTN